mmetsp:Transcript_34757/g.87997  ORF Transcript_34757/g.87997 Transcript_34757/m.87997 type:complete len:500 (-) Transcript_34757:429-1928(-)|eukprot:CAMPEP_0202857534 /NCGR_PEP_ID=MMETSP1391-20130828/438_1 /ASSEMBLY_ACC=CAM_ASM_000867 /TAXON_ID=1034604 /ORGANISM="Chlamydomonas leiostraca, Strain SAG 11-49" /LENGTH=499 /DNA_ID=CAMNT_0049536345 /DNA_START=73 /DNA_END=1572 /DNA_ORIENTATION=-
MGISGIARNLAVALILCLVTQDALALHRKLQSQLGPTKHANRSLRQKAMHHQHARRSLHLHTDRRSLLQASSNETEVAVCEYREADESYYGGHCFTNRTWIESVAPKTAIDVAAEAFEQRLTACSAHVTVDWTDPEASYIVPQDQIDACIADSDHLCFMDVTHNPNNGPYVEQPVPFCNTAPDWVEYQDVPCPDSIDHVHARCMAMSTEECELDEECVTLLEDYLPTLNATILEANGAVTNGTGGWFKYWYCWPMVLADPIFNEEDGSRRPYNEYVDDIIAAQSNLMDTVSLPRDLTPEEWYGNCTYGQARRAQWEFTKRCEAIDDPEYNLLQGYQEQYTLQLEDGSEQIVSAQYLNLTLVQRCAGEEVEGVPVCHVAHGEVYVSEGDKTLVAWARCTQAPWIANAHAYGNSPDVLAAYQACYTSATKYNATECSSTTILVEPSSPSPSPSPSPAPADLTPADDGSTGSGSTGSGQQGGEDSGMPGIMPITIQLKPKKQ